MEPKINEKFPIKVFSSWRESRNGANDFLDNMGANQANIRWQGVRLTLCSFSSIFATPLSEYILLTAFQKSMIFVFRVPLL